MAHPISDFIVKNFYWVFLAALVLNLYQRKFPEMGRRKRFATLYAAIAVFLAYIFGYALVRLSLSDWFLLVFVGGVAVAVYLLRRKVLIFRLKCASCGARLPMEDILGDDENRCAECRATPGSEK